MTKKSSSGSKSVEALTHAEADFKTRVENEFDKMINALVVVEAV